MIRSENIPNAYKEVYTILKYVSKDDVNLIPKNFIKMLKSKMNVNYKFEYNEKSIFNITSFFYWLCKLSKQRFL